MNLQFWRIWDEDAESLCNLNRSYKKDLEELFHR